MNQWLFEIYETAINHEYVNLKQAKESNESELIKLCLSNLEGYIKNFLNNFELFELKNNSLYEKEIKEINKLIDISVKDHALNINYNSYF